ncbi:MAG TPA: DUF503 domain-containing protein [Dehalococcoidia bacterium]|nr:DUF503 domain-containing protein [Dehalococcoidia bacterium]
MHIGVCRLELRLPESQSLKDRRQVARSLTSRIRNQFNVAVAEDADGQLWQRLGLVICCVSNDVSHAHEMMSKMVSFVEESRPDLEILNLKTEIVSGL